MVPSSHCVVSTLHVTILLSHSVIPLFFLTFDGTILTLCRINITCDCIFVTFSGSLIYFSHFMVLFSHYVVPRSYVIVFFLTFNGTIFTFYSTNTYVTVFLSHSVVPLFFSSHFMVLSSHYVVPRSYVIVFFLIFNGTIFTFYSTNTYVTVFLSHSVVSLFFFSHLMVPSSHCAVLASHVT